MISKFSKNLKKLVKTTIYLIFAENDFILPSSDFPYWGFCPHKKVKDSDMTATPKTASFWATALGLAALCMASSAQAQIYRCPNNEYTNDSRGAQARGCKIVEGGNITIIRNSPSAPVAARRETPRVNPPGVRPAMASNAEQRERDMDSRRILEAELDKAQEKLNAQSKQYNGGLPDKQGGEAKNYQKYLDRVAEMKAEISRTESDISGLKREISRLPEAQSNNGSANTMVNRAMQ